MKMNRHKLVKAIWAVVLAAVVAGVGFWPAMSSFADGGNVTVGVNSADAEDAGVPEGTEFKFNLYRIGGFDGPVFTKEDPFTQSKADVSMPRPENYSGTQEQWEEAWATAASTLKAEINAKTFGEPDKIKTASYTIAAGGNTSVTLPRDGLYLLVGEPVITSDGYMWTPTPAFLGMLNGGSLNTGEINIKLSRREVVFKHMVVKSWEKAEKDPAAQYIEDGVKPSEIKVVIMYGDEEVTRVTLNDGNSWTHQWKSIEDDTEEDGTRFEYIPIDKDGNEGTPITIDATEKKAWSVAEVPGDDESVSEDNANKLHYYKVDVEDPDTATIDSEEYDRHRITNTLTTRTLTVRKTIKDFFDADTQNVTAIFEIKGYKTLENKEKKLIYSNYVGINFGPNDELTKERVLKGIPYDVDTIEAKEIYSGNYEPDESFNGGEVKVDPVFENDKLVGWTVTAQNKHNGHGPKGGVVNQYKVEKQGEDPVQDFGK